MCKKFVASYSGGKDSILAIHRAIKLGYVPAALITTYNTDRKRSWFHGIPDGVLQSVSDAVGVPVRLIKTSGEAYSDNFERTLVSARELGAELCVFGDIDIEAHNQWCTQRCANAGMQALFPLWGEARRSLVAEFIDSGYTANFTVIDTSRMDARYLGQQLTHAVVAELESAGVDVCGENGEYHTFVSAGPLFQKKVAFHWGKTISEGKHVVLPILEAF